MEEPAQLAQSHLLLQLQILAQAAAAQVGLEVVIWSAETALAEL
jgi:hypothetical protein